MKNKLIIPTLLVAMGGLATVSTSQVSAQDVVFTSPHDSVVQKFVQKFGLKESEVQAVFDEVRTEHQAQMQAKMEEKLTADVAAGKITEQQKQAILAKLKEMHAEMPRPMQGLRTMPPQERRQVMEQRRTELENWAKANGIDPEYLKFKMFIGKNI